ncbi:MAG: hypothetical protein ABW171_01660 [Steroidobacter sp.]
MSNPPGQGGDRKDPAPSDSDLPEASDAPAEDARSGRITYDDRGNSVWEWKLDSGVYSRDINTQRLKKLDLDELSIADTAINKRPPGLGGKPGEPMPGGGFNPYDNSSTGRGNVGSSPYNSGNRAPLKPEPKPAEPKQRKPMDLKRLQEWMEIRKRVEQNKREDEDE